MSTVIGSPVDRVDGQRKVTGAARYAADYVLDNVAYAVPVVSTIGKGHVEAIESGAASAAPGVLAIITRQNCPKLSRTSNDFGAWTKMGEKRLPFEDDEVHYAGQYLAVVVAGTLEQAIAAASLVSIRYREEAPAVTLEQGNQSSYVPQGNGFAPVNYARSDLNQAKFDQARVDEAISAAPVVIDQTYATPVEHHNPMEPSATLAAWHDGDLTLYDATQWVMGARNCVADMLGIDRERVRIVSQFVGGGFGCKGFIWPHQIFAAVAAKMVDRPVKLVLSRQIMFTACGHRPQTRQRVVLAAGRDGHLQAMRHDTLCSSSTVDEFAEQCGVATPLLYQCPNLSLTHRVAPVNIATPTAMRAPGENPGLFAVESAMDELAWMAGVDPVELRLRNYAEKDQHKGLPFSSKHLRKCYELGRERIGWSDRAAQPAAMRDGRYLLGYGMATATYPGYRMPGAAFVRLHDDGAVSVGSATQDIGGGTYTIMSQIAAETLGIPIEKIRPALGDSRLPPAPVSGGSMTTASVGPAVKQAAEDLLKKLTETATQLEESPFHGRKPDDLAAGGGKLGTKDGSLALPYADVLRALRMDRIEGDARVQPGEEAAKYSFHSFGAQFAKVRVDPDLGTVRVLRMVSIFDAGRIMNPKTARSQALGGIIQGIGMALMEETHYDPRNARVVSDNLADYLVPVHADIRQIEPDFLNIPDPYISALGARGVGELAITGVAPAIANAVYHATGKRIRELPITIEKLLD